VTTAVATVGILTKIQGFGEVQKVFQDLSRGNLSLTNSFRTSGLASTQFGIGMTRLAGDASRLLGILGTFSPILGALSVVGFVHAVKSAEEFGDQLAITANKLGVTTTVLQEFQHVAKLTGVEQGELTTGLRFLTRNMGEAAQGSKAATENFRRLGVNVFDASGKVKSTEVVFQELADGIMKMGSEAERNAALMEIFGRSGVALAPLFEQGGEAIKNMREEAHRLGLILDENLIRGAQAANDTFDRLTATIDIAYKRIFISLSPAVAQLDATIQRLSPRLQEWAGTMGTTVGKALVDFFEDTDKAQKKLEEFLRIGEEGAFVALATRFGVIGTAIALVGVALNELRTLWLDILKAMGAENDNFLVQLQKFGVTAMAILKDLSLAFDTMLLKGIAAGFEGIGDAFDKLFVDDTNITNTGRAMVDLEDATTNLVGSFAGLGQAAGPSARLAAWQASAKTAADAATALQTETSAAARELVRLERGLGPVAAATAGAGAAVETLSVSVRSNTTTFTSAEAVQHQVAGAQLKMAAATAAQEEATKLSTKAAEDAVKVGETHKKLLKDITHELLTGARVDAETASERLRTTERLRNAEERYGVAIRIAGEDRVHASQIGQRAIAGTIAAQEALGRSSGMVFAKMNTAMVDYFRDLGDKAKNSAKAVTAVMDSMVDTIARFLETGKLSFKSFFDSIKHEFAQLAAKNLVFSMFGGGPGAPGGGGTGGNILTSLLSGLAGLIGGGGAANAGGNTNAGTGGGTGGGAPTGGGGGFLGGLGDIFRGVGNIFSSGVSAGGGTVTGSGLPGGTFGGPGAGGVPFSGGFNSGFNPITAFQNISNFGFGGSSGGPNVGGSGVSSGSPFGGGGLMGFGGPGLLDPGGFSMANLGADFGAGMTGMLIGNLLGSMFGTPGAGGIGSTIGGAVGGIAGSFFGPVGSFVGSTLGSLVGGLFGGEARPPAVEAGAIIDALGGRVGEVETGSGGSKAQGKELAQGFLDVFNQTVAALGGNVTGSYVAPSLGIVGGKFFIQPSGDIHAGNEGRLQFDTAEEAIGKAVQIAIARGKSTHRLTGISGKVLSTFGGSLDRGLDQALSDALFAKQFFAPEGNPITGDLLKQIKTFEEGFVDMGVRALSLKLPVNKVIDQYRDARIAFVENAQRGKELQKTDDLDETEKKLVDTSFAQELKTLDTAGQLLAQIKMRFALFDTPKADASSPSPPPVVPKRTGTGHARELATGGSFIANRPTSVLVGEHGVERVDVTPLRRRTPHRTQPDPRKPLSENLTAALGVMRPMIDGGSTTSMKGGGTFFVSRPTTFMTGESGSEKIEVTPLRGKLATAAVLAMRRGAQEEGTASRPFATGGKMLTQRPTRIMAGERGVEQVDVTPMRAAFRQFATGGSFIAQSPTVILAGESGSERVDVTPMRTGAAQRGGDVNVTFSGPAVIDDLSMSRFLRQVDRGLRARERRLYG
jgi:lambda family phage tail tape measure protein